MLCKRLRCAIFMIVCSLLSLTAVAQNRQLTGRVTDLKDGSPIPGASVVVKGTSFGVVSGADGSFSISVPKGRNTLVVSIIGYTTQDVAIGAGAALDVKLASNLQGLNEVVVVGYGTRKVQDLTGSVAQLTAKDFNKGQISTPEQLLQGRTPGVSITPSSGEPGAAATVNIRGTFSIRGNQQPLYVVDGVPIVIGGTAGNDGSVEGSSTAKNPLMFLNPSDIESISILKDASSAAIYGVRGANGVILITTKSGKSGKGAFDFGANMTIAGTAKRYDLMNASQFLDAVANAKDKIGAGRDVSDIDKGSNTDWQDEIFRTGISQNYNLAWGINHKGTNFRISGSYDDQQGIVKRSELKRYTTKANISQKLWKDKIKLDGMFSYSNVRNQYPPISNNAGFQGSLIGAAIIANPTFPIRATDGSYYTEGTARNPVEMLNSYIDGDKINRFLGNVSASWKIVDGLTYKATVGYDYSSGARLAVADARLNPTAYGMGNINIFGVEVPSSALAGNGRATRQKITAKSTLVEHTLTFDKTFAEKHSINAMAGFAYQDQQEDRQTTYGFGLKTPVTKPTDVMPYDYNAFKNYKDGVPDNYREELQSYFGRINYIYDERYYLTATMRADGSTKFGPDNKYGYFPAFAAKWRLINEGFIKSGALGRAFSDLAIRLNYGKLGSQDGIPANAAVNLLRRWYGADGQKENQKVWNGNPNLKWEEATTIGAGIDFTLVGNRLNGTIDYFNTKRRNTIFYDYYPGGFSPNAFWFVNLPGYVQNNGIEFGINATPVKGDKFTWDISLNATFVKNRVHDYNRPPVNTGEVSGQGLSGAYAQTIINNYPLFTWKMPVFQGLDGDGKAIYADGGNDQLLGSALPTRFGGLTNTFTYGRLTASIFFSGSGGFYIYNNTANAFFVKGSVLTAHNSSVETGASNEYPLNPGSVSSRFLEKGDFIRLANANISYNVPVKMKGIRSLNVYVSGQNLALFTKYSGLDPEVNVNKQIGDVPSRGFDYAGYPKARSVNFGLNLGF